MDLIQEKPVSHCSVELSFDNSENFLGGEYLKFDEVSVKRKMGRDGQSTYFINNAVARRRDVQDLFLGTGLGEIVMQLLKTRNYF